MPTLNWAGKDKVARLDVPPRVLRRKWAFGEDDGNMVIHGDNLEALKALLPRYEGRVDCIFIDPPYNTGNEGWVYNDNVSDPQLKKWFGQVVGREGEDFSRHDKWLCMMYPRLKLLRKLLARDGIIVVSIDDNELYNLGLVMDEIFGASNRLACAPWLSEPSGGKGKTGLRIGHEYLLLYTGGSNESVSRDERSAGLLNLKDAKGKYRKGRELRKWGAGSSREDRPKMWFGIKAPDGTVVFPYKNDGTEGRWRWGVNNKEMQELLSNPNHAHWEKCPYDNGVEVNGERERWVPFEKIRDESHAIGWSTWLDKYGFNSDGTSDLKSIFGEKIFDTPKPLRLVQWVVSLYDGDDCLVLDSFAGSGTTAHAVLKANAADRGSRQFILVENMDYAEEVTAERVKRVIGGYGEGEKAVAGTGGGFGFFELGPEVFGEDGELNDGELGEEELRAWVWELETRGDCGPVAEGGGAFLGMDREGTAVYFCHERGRETVLDRRLLRKLKRKGSGYVVYADGCTLGEDELRELRITFRKVARDLKAGK